MKVTVDVECTPAEAREVLGLPDVRPIQAAMMKKFEAQMSASVEKLSPDAVLSSWFNLDPKNWTRIQDVFANFISHAVTRTEA